MERAFRMVLAFVIGAGSGFGAAHAGTSADELKKDATTPGDVLTYGMGYAQQRYSTLTQISTNNVKRLVPIWNLSLNSSANASTQPLVIDGVMYVASHDATVAIDALTGKQKWRVPIELPADIAAFLCCGVHSRGLAVLDGVLYRTTLDAHVMAIDMTSGKTVWRNKTADYKEGYSQTHAPLIANGVLITGMSGGEYGARGFLNGWNPKTGEKLWTRYTTAAPGEKGGDTWNPGAYEKGGAPTWLTGSYDPELDLVYWGTGNGSPWNASFRGGDSLYISSVLAIRPKTGEVAWHFQFSPGDPYDYDGTNELINADLKIKGKTRKVIMQANRNGYFYVLDRASGELLAANQFVKKLNWASGIDMKTGRPIDTDVTKMIRTTLEMKTPSEIWPSAFGGKNWMPMSYNPKTGLAYANTINLGMNYRAVKPEFQKGQLYFGIDPTVTPLFLFPKDATAGALSAIDPLTGKTKWEFPTPTPFWAGVLSTAGNLVFTGAQTGEFMAFDAGSGKKLWQFQTGSGITGLPITWSHKGKQYVTVTSGSATVYLAYTGDPNLANVPSGSSVWTFAIRE